MEWLDSLVLILPLSMVFMQIFLILVVGLSLIKGRINMLAYLVLTAVAFLSGWHGILAVMVMQTDLEAFYFGTLGVAALIWGIFAIYLGVVATLHFFPDHGPLQVITLRGKNLWLFVLAIVLATVFGVALHGFMYR